MIEENVHYHIRTFTGFSVIVDYAYTYEELTEKFQKRVQMIKDLTGCNVLNKTDYITTFENNASVKWQPCYKDFCNVQSQHMRVK